MTEAINMQDSDIVRRYKRIKDDVTRFIEKDLTFRPSDLYFCMFKGDTIYPQLLSRDYETKTLELMDVEMGIAGALLFTKAKARNVVFEWNQRNPEQKLEIIGARNYALQVINGANGMIRALSSRGEI